MAAEHDGCRPGVLGRPNRVRLCGCRREWAARHYSAGDAALRYYSGMCRRLYAFGYDRDNLASLANLAVVKAALTYRPADGSPANWIYTTVGYDLMAAIRSARRRNGVVLVMETEPAAPADEPAQAAEAVAVDIDALLDAAFDDARQWAAQATGGE